MELVNSLYIAGAGMKAQSDRLQIVAENIANSDSTGNSPGADPYRRKVISFHNVLNKELGVSQVQINRYGVDKSDFKLEYNPNHPAADADGYVKMPNVNPLIEMVDMREARRGYEANVNVVEVTKGMLTQTINMLK
jgi:flagellar basal-body rod protein FlgC